MLFIVSPPGSLCEEETQRVKSAAVSLNSAPADLLRPSLSVHVWPAVKETLTNTDLLCVMDLLQLITQA